MLNGLVGMLLAAVALTGVTGERLKARAFFDANNVKVGDPMVLTVDFIGSADFAALHPPALARVVDRKTWRVDDDSAKTDTFRDARRLTYRVRPLREGVLWFPEVEFAYSGPDGAPQTVRSNAIPVHAKPGAQVVVEGLGEDVETMPEPPPLRTRVESVVLTDDDDFAWRRACSKPTADAFADFDFPEGRFNEARCAILEGDWKRALGIYSKLEWRVGQTPEVERGIVAALATRYQNPQVELPVWRQVGRIVLRHGWKGRVGLVVGALVGIVLLFWLLSRAIRLLACLALIALPFAASAEDPFAIFEQMEEHMRQMQQQMQQRMNAFGFLSGGEMAQEQPVRIVATVKTSKPELQVGDGFEFICELDAPKDCSLEQIQLEPSETFGLRSTGHSQNLPDAESANPSNVVKRFSVPVRYDVPFRGELSFTVGGMVSARRRRGRMNYSFSNSFSTKTAPVKVDVKPLASDGQPDDFSGIVAVNVSLVESTDGTCVESNDVITLTYALRHDGYLPADWMPDGVAFEWERGTPANAGPFRDVVVWRRYFVADGADRTPELVFSYYDPKTKTYKRVRAGGRHVTYR